METMQWSEISNPSFRNDSGCTRLGVRDRDVRGGMNENRMSFGAPTIKNHTVTYFNNHLYCFGGYDGRRNHNLLLLYSIQQQRWIQPHCIHNNNNNKNSSVDGIDRSQENTNDFHRDANRELEEAKDSIVNDMDIDSINDGNNSNSNNVDTVSDSQNIPNDARVRLENEGEYSTRDQLRNNHPFRSSDEYHSTGGAYTVTGNAPPGRNGHTATLATDEDDNDEQDEENITGCIVILGGWLGQGPLAAHDMHVLDISRGGHHLRWYKPAVKGTPPGPCNMHTADYVKARKEVFVFRGGNGREYLNDIHALHVSTMTWRKVSTTGEIPQKRANHCSSFLEDTGELFIFGGWNGTTRLNDIHILDTATCNWTRPEIGGVLPHPRAGMTLTALRGRLYLFGGSGTSSKCFQDLNILDRDGQSWNWLDITQCEIFPHSNNSSNSSNRHHRHHHHSHRSEYEYLPYHRTDHFPHSSQIFPPQNHFSTHNHHQHHSDQYQNYASANRQDNGYHPFDNYEQYHYSNNHIPRKNGEYIGTGMPQNRQRLGDINIGSNDNVNNNTSRAGSFTLLRADWTSRELASLPRSIDSFVASPNPNDEDTAPTVMLRGIPPGSRAGHTATAVHRKIYVFGGSCGSDYLNDFYMLDTDPPPLASVTEATSSHLIERRLRHFFNDEKFSDVTFLIQGRKVYGHKMVLAIVSDCFRAMFTAGFRESSSSEIEITGCSYEAFLAVMEYIYTGSYPNSEIQGTLMVGSNHSSKARVVDILELADRFFLDHLKQVCEAQLQAHVKSDTVEYLLQVAQKTNAMQLQEICEHYTRNQNPDSDIGS